MGKTGSPEPVNGVLMDRVRVVRHVALDLDGTLYRGRTVFQDTVPFLKLLRGFGIGRTFLTNNPSKQPAELLAHLRQLGIDADESELYTSAHATIELLRTRFPGIRRVFLLGTPGLADTFSRAGFELTSDSPNDQPDAVVVGFDLTLTHSRLCRAAWWIERGVPWFATNPDRVCPTDQPTVLVDCGSICAAPSAATGRSPLAIAGKPDPAMLHGILHRHALKPPELAMIGDRLYTDIAMARETGALAVLVLTGETKPEQAANANPAPDVVVATLGEFGVLIAESRNRASFSAAPQSKSPTRPVSPCESTNPL
ncbi:MAG: HAD-IIA family hydrolase [Verrucomicrobiae bacterium]|nr:HAD-IIA family hydrolase [Verrucomicrobiae bacterium]